MRTPTHGEARQIVTRLDADPQVKAALILYINVNAVCEGWDLPTVARVADMADRQASGAIARVSTLHSAHHELAASHAALMARMAEMERILDAVSRA